MIALIVLACVALVILLLLVMRVGCCVDYSQDGLVLDLKVGFVHIRLLPGKKTPGQQERKEAKTRAKKQKKEQRAQAKKEKQEKKREKEKAKKRKHGEKPQEQEKNREEGKKKGDLSWLLKLISPAMTALGRLRRKLRVKRLAVDYSVPGASDPAGAALRYGMISAGGGALFPMLNAVLDVEDWDVSLDVDFTAEKTKLTLSAQADWHLGTLLHIVLALGFQALKAYLISRKQSESKEDTHHGREASDRRDGGNHHGKTEGNDRRQHHRGRSHPDP